MLSKQIQTFLCVSLYFVIIVCRCEVLLKLSISMTAFLFFPKKIFYRISQFSLLLYIDASIYEYEYINEKA